MHYILAHKAFSIRFSINLLAHKALHHMVFNLQVQGLILLVLINHIVNVGFNQQVYIHMVKYTLVVLKKIMHIKVHY